MELGQNGSAVYVLTSNVRPGAFDVAVANSVEEQTMANVVGVIPGRRSDEIVLFGAHYDHIGIRNPVEGDSIANGANDNATGTTAVALLAKYFKTLRRPERTLMFVAFTAEEMGRHGSRHVAQQIEADQVVAMINFEMLGKPEQGRSNRAWVTGFEKSSLGKTLQSAVDTSEYLFYADPQPDQNLFMRSDNVPFARLGIPAHTISTGLLEDDHDYHQVTDEIETIDVAHMTQTIAAIAKAVMPLVTGEATPTRIDTSAL
jgi:Zn-dependent M28 family amino/carboxypeptidase